MSSNTLKQLAPYEVKKLDKGYEKYVEKPIETEKRRQDEMRAAEAETAAASIAAEAKAKADAEADAESQRTARDATRREQAIDSGRRAGAVSQLRQDYDALGSPNGGVKRRGAASALLG